MEFQQSWFLLGLPIVLLVAWFARRRGPQRVIPVGSLALWRKAASSQNLSEGANRPSTSWWCLLIGSLLAMLAASQPTLNFSPLRREMTVAVYPSAELAIEENRAALLRAAEALAERLASEDRVRLVTPIEAGGVDKTVPPEELPQSVASLGALPLRAKDMTFSPEIDASKLNVLFAPSTSQEFLPASQVVAFAKKRSPVTLENIAAEPVDENRITLLIGASNPSDSSWVGALRILGYDENGNILWKAPTQVVGIDAGERKEFVPQTRAAPIIGAWFTEPGTSLDRAICSGFLAADDPEPIRVAIQGSGGEFVRRYVRADPQVRKVSSLGEADVVFAIRRQPPRHKNAIVFDAPRPPNGYAQGDRYRAAMLRDADVLSDDPVMQNVDLSGIAVRTLQTWERVSESVQRIKPLVRFGDGAIILRDRSDDLQRSVRRVYVSFAPVTENTNAMTSPGFVVFLANAVRYAASRAVRAMRYRSRSSDQTANTEDWEPVIRGPGSAAADSAIQYQWPGVYRRNAEKIVAVNLFGSRETQRQALDAAEQISRIELPNPRRDADATVPFAAGLLAAAMVLLAIGWILETR